MEELFELREHIEQGNYAQALLLVEEMEEMSKEDKINKIYSYAAVLLMHLIKQEAEQRTTRSWDFSIYNSVQYIARTNRRHKAGGVYVPPEDMRDLLKDAYTLALKRASIEAFEGQFTEKQLESKTDPERVRQTAFQYIQEALSVGKKAK